MSRTGPLTVEGWVVEAVTEARRGAAAEEAAEEQITEVVEVCITYPTITANEKATRLRTMAMAMAMALLHGTGTSRTKTAQPQI